MGRISGLGGECSPEVSMWEAWSWGTHAEGIYLVSTGSGLLLHGIDAGSQSGSGLRWKGY